MNQEMIDWGVRSWTPRVAAACLRPARDRKIRSASAYVGVCRRLNNSLHDIDGRLVAAGWNMHSPTSWVGDELERFLNYWDSTQARPLSVGSPYNDEPECVARAFRLDIPPELYPQGLGHLLPVRWTGGHRRIRALIRLGRKLHGAHLPHMRTADLVRLSKLSGAFLRAMLGHSCTSDWLSEDSRVNWAYVAKLADRFLELPREKLQELRIPAARWLEICGNQKVVDLVVNEYWIYHGAIYVYGRAIAVHIRGNDVYVRCSGRDPDIWLLFEEQPKLPCDSCFFESWWRSVCTKRNVRREWRRFEDPLTRSMSRRIYEWRLERRRLSKVVANGMMIVRDALEKSWAAAIHAAPFSPRQDEGGAFVGYRTWALSLFGTLVSPHQGTEWRSASLTADEFEAGSKVRNAPGIHAYWNLAECVTLRGVRGEVRGYGRVQYGREGWRAEIVEIVRLFVARGTDPATVAALRDRYQVPVEVAR